MCQSVTQQIVAHVVGHAAPGHRVQHAKAHGIVRATLIVRAPDGLRHGIFADPGVWPALIRYSASSPIPRSDRWPDVHGMAIKVMGPWGEQDMILANCPVFFVRNAADYLVLLKAGVLRFVATRPRELVNLARATLHHVDDPLAQTYHSQTPYAYGPHEVKIVVTPRSAGPRPTQVPGQPTPRGADRLRGVLQERLRGEVTLNLGVVLRQPGDPLDDPRIRWRAAPVNVATILIGPQELTDTAAGETLRYNPVSCHVDHRPLGEINAVRAAVYAAAADLRAAAAR